MGIYQRGKNYYIDFYHKKKRYREKVGHSRKLAETVQAKKEVEVAEGYFLDKKKELPPVKFHDFAREYLQWSKANKKPSTYERDISLMRQLDSEFGKKNLHEITTWQIEKYKARRKEKIKRPGAVMGCSKEKDDEGREKTVWLVEYDGREGKRVKKSFGNDQLRAQAFFTRSNEPLRPASVNREMALLKHMYSRAIEWGKLKESPAKKVKMLKGEVRRVRFLLPAEIGKLLSCCPDSLRPMVRVV